jgi:CubicO group peptidase (beta-lactamase class C family)
LHERIFVPLGMRDTGFSVPAAKLDRLATAHPGRSRNRGAQARPDPKDDLTAILMTQRGGFPLFSGVYLDFWTSVYQVIDY